VLGRFIAVDSQAPPKISIDHSRDSGDTPGNRKLLFLCRLSVEGSGCWGTKLGPYRRLSFFLLR
jgi:hypothetical protein